MTRPRRSYGRPGTAVIPADWATDLRPVAEGTMTASAAIRHPGTTQTWDDDTQQNVETPTAAYWTGTCRAQALTNTRGFDAEAAGEQVTVAGYLVTVPATVEPATGDLVDVTGSGDPMLDGRTLRVRDSVQGSLIVERDLFCNFADRL